MRVARLICCVPSANPLPTVCTPDGLMPIFGAVTDRYPFRGAIKGSFTWLKPKVIVFTSNSHPFEWYPNLSDFDKAAIERRITEITVVE